jgi:hypothetical protein
MYVLGRRKGRERETPHQVIFWARRVITSPNPATRATPGPGPPLQAAVRSLLTWGFGALGPADEAGSRGHRGLPLDERRAV